MNNTYRVVCQVCVTVIAVVSADKHEVTITVSLQYITNCYHSIILFTQCFIHAVQQCVIITIISFLSCHLHDNNQAKQQNSASIFRNLRVAFRILPEPHDHVLFTKGLPSYRRPPQNNADYHRLPQTNVFSY